MDDSKNIDFFIVGAPKCGTTSLNYYLNQHPEIFMIEKEVHFFGKDLNIKNQLNDFSKYLDLQNGSKSNQKKGDASVWYLYSNSAPIEIKERFTDSKIIVMLRNPVEMIYSLHGENLYNADESEIDFEKALALERSRSNGQNIPSSARFKQCLLYRENGKFVSRIKHYIDRFGKDNVKVIILEEFKSDPKSSLKTLFDFLLVDSSVNIDLTVQNEAKSYQSLWLHQNIKNKNSSLKKAFRILIPVKSIRQKISDTIYNRNINKAKKQEMADHVRKELIEYFSDEVSNLEKLLNINLDIWRR